MDELLRWFAEQHAAGVTVRGGRLRPPKQHGQVAGGKQPGPTQSAVKKVQILQQEILGPHSSMGATGVMRPRARSGSFEGPPAPESIA